MSGKATLVLDGTGKRGRRYLFSSVLDGRNSSLTPDIEHLLGHRPRDFAAYAREAAATGVWSVAA
ncbi:hypothetical protein QM996_11320 [Sinorhizobium chiapasense]